MQADLFAISVMVYGKWIELHCSKVDCMNITVSFRTWRFLLEHIHAQPTPPYLLCAFLLWESYIIRLQSLSKTISIHVRFAMALDFSCIPIRTNHVISVMSALALALACTIHLSYCVQTIFSLKNQPYRFKPCMKPRFGIFLGLRLWFEGLVGQGLSWWDGLREGEERNLLRTQNTEL